MNANLRKRLADLEQRIRGTDIADFIGWEPTAEQAAEILAILEEVLGSPEAVLDMLAKEPWEQGLSNLTDAELAALCAAGPDLSRLTNGQVESLAQGPG